MHFAKLNFNVKIRLPTNEEKEICENNRFGPEISIERIKNHIPIFAYNFRYATNAGFGDKEFIGWIYKSAVEKCSPDYYNQITGLVDLIQI